MAVRVPSRGRRHRTHCGEHRGGCASSAQVESNGARPEPVHAPARGSGTAAADGAVQAGEAEQATRPKPVPPPRSGDQREAARLKAVQVNGERKEIRDQLQQGRLSLAQALAQDGGRHAECGSRL